MSEQRIPGRSGCGAKIYLPAEAAVDQKLTVRHALTIMRLTSVLRAIATYPVPEQDNQSAANMRMMALDALKDQR